MSHNLNWEYLDRRPGYRGSFRSIDVVRYKLPDGSVAEFEIIVETPGVSIVAITKEKQVILIKQFRPGPDKVMLELPGGGVDKGMTPQEAAHAELAQETGYTIGRLIELPPTYRTAYTTHVNYNFIALDCELTQPTDLESTEFIEPVLVPLDEYARLLSTASVIDVDTGLLALTHLRQNETN